MVEHFWRRGLDLVRAFLNVNYHVQDPYDQGFSPNNGVTPEDLNLSFAQSVLEMDRPASRCGRRLLIWSKRNPVSLMTHLVKTFCPAGGAVLDFRTGMWSTAKACLLALKHFKFFGCEAANSYLPKSVHFISQLFAHQIVNDDSDINKSEERHEAERRYLQGKAYAEKTWRMDLWKTPPGLHSVQAFINHIVFMLSQNFNHMDLFLHENHLLYTVCRKRLVSQLNSCGVRSLLSHNCSVCDVHIKKSTTAHSQTGMGCFANQ